MFWITFEIVALLVVIGGIVIMARADRRTAQQREAEEQTERARLADTTRDPSKTTHNSNDPS